MTERSPRMRTTCLLLPAMLAAALCGCGQGKTEERQPSAAEMRAFVDEIERKEAAHKAEAIAAARAKEKEVAKEHEARLKAQK